MSRLTFRANRIKNDQINGKLGFTRLRGKDKLGFTPLKPPSPREVGRRAILRRVGRSVALRGACFPRHTVPAAEAAEGQRQNQGQISSTRLRREPPRRGSLLKGKAKPDDSRLRLGGRSDGRALNCSLPSRFRQEQRGGEGLFRRFDDERAAVLFGYFLRGGDA